MSGKKTKMDKKSPDSTLQDNLLRRSLRTKRPNAAYFAEEAKSTEATSNMEDVPLGTRMSPSKVTPRTLVEGFIQGHDTIQTTTRKRPRIQMSPKRVSPMNKSPRQSPSRTISKSLSASLRKKATMKNFLQKNTDGPTPRGLIQEFVGHAPTETPVIGTVVNPRTVEHEAPQSPGLDKTRVGLDGDMSLDDSFMRSYQHHARGRLNTLKSRRGQHLRKPSSLKSGTSKTLLEDIDKIQEYPERKEAQHKHRSSSGKKRGRQSDTVASKSPLKQLSNDSNMTNMQVLGEVHSSISGNEAGHISHRHSNGPMEDSSVVESEENEHQIAPDAPGYVEQTEKDPEAVDKQVIDNAGENKQSCDDKSQDKILQEEELPQQLPQEEQSEEEQLQEEQNEQLQEEQSQEEQSQEEELQEEESQEEQLQEEQSQEEQNEQSQEEQSQEEQSQGQFLLEKSTQDESSHSVGISAQRQQKSTDVNTTETQQLFSDDEDDDPNESNSKLYMPNLRQLKITDILHSPVLQLMDSENATMNSSLALLTQTNVPPLSTKPQTKQTSHHSKSTKVVQSSSKKNPPRLPRSLTKGIFQHFTKTNRISKEVIDEIEMVADAYWKNVVNDLMAYSNHAHRRGIEASDVELLMKRQGFITEKQSLYSLVEDHLPMEYRQEIIPIARSGNKIEPK